MEELSLVIRETFARPELFDDSPPFSAVFVADIVLPLCDSEQLEFILIPSADHVEGKTALPNVIGRGHLLGRDDRMDQRRVDGAEHIYAACLREQAARPGDGFQAFTIYVGRATMPFPSRDRHQAFDSCLIR